MPERWELTVAADNAGKPLSVWSWRDYELCQNVNLGFEGGWVFELTLHQVRLGLFATLKEGKEAAHRREAPTAGSDSNEHRAEVEAVTFEAAS